VAATAPPGVAGQARLGMPQVREIVHLADDIECGELWSKWIFPARKARMVKEGTLFALSVV